MRNSLENHLSQLEAPSVPDNLKARCLATIPAPVRTSVVAPRIRPFVLPRIAASGALMLVVGLGIAFWNTRPGDNNASESSGSVAFAQTMEAIQKVSFGHVKGRDMEAGILRKGWHASDFFQTEVWFDATRGFYQTRQANPSNTQPGIAKRVSAQKLFLPDGISYYRYDGSKMLLVTSSRSHWNSYKKEFITLLAGGWAGQLKSSSPAQWKGQKALLFQGEAKPSREDQKAMPGISRVHAYLYVNPATKLPLAYQDFFIYSDGIPRLTTEYEFDFTRPDASRFDPAPAKKGAVIEHSKEVG